MKTTTSLPAPALLPVSPLASLVGKQIGWLRVNKPVTNRRANYECAAWWQDEQSAVGVFPLVLAEDAYRKSEFFAIAKLPGTVTDCSFASLWCGNAIGKYDKAQDVGRACELAFRVELSKLVHGTGGHYPENLPAQEFTVIWGFVPSFIAHYKAKAQNWFAVASQALAASLETDKTGAREIFGWGSFASYAQWAGESAKQAEEIGRDLGYQMEAGDSWRKLAAKNYAWAPS